MPLDRRALLEEGWTTVPLLSTSAIGHLRDEFDRLGVDDDAFFASSMHLERSEAVRVDQLVKGVLGPAVADLLPGYQGFLGAFLSKAPHGDNPVDLHQDWTYVDEPAHRAYLFWCPLIDLSASDGPLGVAPGSHRWLPNLRGSGAFPAPYEKVAADVIARFGRPITLAAGEALVYDAALLHYSPPVRADRVRPVAALALAPAQARLVHYHAPGDGGVEGYVIDADYYTHQEFGTRPQGYPALEVEGAVIEPISVDELVAVAGVSLPHRVARAARHPVVTARRLPDRRPRRRTDVGIVGAGYVAGRHVDVVRRFPDVRVVGVADPDRARAEALADRCGARAYSDHDELLASHTVDALLICVPPSAHGAPELAAIERKIPFLVEKPLAVDVEGAEAIAEEVTAAGLVTAVGYHWRYLPTTEHLQDELAGSPPSLFTAHWLDAVAPPEWWRRQSQSGGQVIEQATHLLDLARLLVGEVCAVAGMGAAVDRPDVPGLDFASASTVALEFQSGAVGSLVATSLLASFRHAGVEVFGPGFAARLDERQLVIERGGEQEEITVEDELLAVTRQDRAFIDVARGRRGAIRVDYDEALRTHRLACAVAAASEGGERVVLSTAAAPAVAVVPPRDTAGDGPLRIGFPSLLHVGVDRAGRLEVPPGGYRVETLFSGFSAGTELATLRGTSPHVRSGWDPDHAVFRPERGGVSFPVWDIGYMEVGRVSESAVSTVGKGQVLAMAYGHRSSHVAAADDLAVPVPADLDPLVGIYLSTMGPVSANAMLHAAVEQGAGPDAELGHGVAGRRVLVLGGGVVGLLTGTFASWLGAAEVLVADVTPQRLEAAATLGLEPIDGRRTDPWRVAKDRWRHGVGDCGADVVFQCRGRLESLAEGLRALRPGHAVVDLAFYTGRSDVVDLAQEFHHNGLVVRAAQVAGIPRLLAPAWDRSRLVGATVDLLRDRGEVLRRALITDVVPFSAAPELIADVADRRRHVLQAVFVPDP